jgi:hypothetical protein
MCRSLSCYGEIGQASFGEIAQKITGGDFSTAGFPHTLLFGKFIQ